MLLQAHLTTTHTRIYTCTCLLAKARVHGRSQAVAYFRNVIQSHSSKQNDLVWLKLDISDFVATWTYHYSKEAHCQLKSIATNGYA